ncbi:WD40 repeat protein [Saccharomonospora amisosensis]|uniref:non-specific serine/threonine protein kinase n=1 Tax=Saccharomonospora amisosensis TaxID=1128677 RepID=A0A7X5ZPW2_9PSEU|nr:serine/threonine-protein kinase [Saccharomonospora amisosensis]NIJ11127.1 WD40 repeat protein [Saccharomonospora amisosensis]
MAIELLGGRYRIVDVLGRGGMGQVYRALDTRLGRTVALKLLTDTADEHHADRLRREAELVSRLADRHIVEVLDAGEVDGRLYVAMRLVEGPDLRRVLGHGPLEPRRAVRILSQVAAALDSAHQAGIVHRDVKPSNILLAEHEGEEETGEQAFLTDFGIAVSLVPEATRLTRTGSYVGSLDYIAPEQLRGQDVTGAADVYSLACVLYECLTGKVPFPAADAAAKLAAQLNDPPAAPSVFDPRIPPSLDLVVATGMDKDPRRRYASAGELLAAADSALADRGPSAPPSATAPGAAGSPDAGGDEVLLRAIVSAAQRRHSLPANGRGGDGEQCPYPGLRSFDTGDAAWFHGRAAEVTELLVRLSRQLTVKEPVVVLGASGTGKSSLLRAGLFPALDAAGCDWPRVALTPGDRPVETLATRLAAVTGADPAALAESIRRQPAAFGEHCTPTRGERPLIVVDQFEQLFTDGASAADRAAFSEALACASPAAVIVAVRADYLPDCIALERLRAGLDNPVVVGPLGPTRLREVITVPAAAAGLSIEDGLVERLVADIGAGNGGVAERGALPRLAHALRETWNNREGDTLTLAGYQATGGVTRAVAVSADQLYQRLDAAAATASRSTLLRLVKVLPDGAMARRRADRGELDPDAVAQLIEARLATADEEGVRLAHDALLTAWPRLREWVEADRQELLSRQRLHEAADAWREGGRDRGDLYRGARLAEAVERAQAHGELTDGEREFLDASRREQQRSTRRLRGVVAGLAVLLVAALLATGLAVSARDDADTQAQLALSRQLAAESLALAEWDPVGARRTALRAWRAAPTAEARGALLSVDNATYPVRHESGLDPVFTTDVSADGGLVAIGGMGRSGAEVVVLDTTSGERFTLATGLGSDPVQAVRFSPDAGMLAVAVFGEAKVGVWDVAQRRRLARLDKGAVALGPIAWRADGTALAAQTADGAESRIGAWNPRTGRFQRWLTGAAPDGLLAFDLAFSRDGSRLAVGRIDGAVELWNPDSGELVHRDTAHSDAAPDGESTMPAKLAFSQGLLASASMADNDIRLRDAATGEPVGEIADRTRHTSDPTQGPGTLAFSGDGAYLLTGTGGRVIVWDPVDRTRLGEYPNGPGQGPVVGQTVIALAASADGSTTVAAQVGGGILSWPRSGAWFERATGSVLGLAFQPGGTHAAAVDGDGKLYTWDYSTGRAAAPRELTSIATAVAYAGDGTRVVGALDGAITVEPPGGKPLTLELGAEFRGHLAISADSTLLAAASARSLVDQQGSRIRVWELATGRRLAGLDDVPGGVSALAFSTDGSRLLAASSEEPAQVTDSVGGAAVRLLSWPARDLTARPTEVAVDSPVLDAAFTPDGRNLVLASLNGHIEVRDADTGRLRREFGNHPSAVRALAIAPDGSTLATATTDDATVWLWDLAEGSLLARLNSGNGFEVNDLAFSPDGGVLARAGSDTDVAMWRIDTDAVVQRVCRSLAEVGEPTADLGCGGD